MEDPEWSLTQSVELPLELHGSVAVARALETVAPREFCGAAGDVLLLHGRSVPPPCDSDPRNRTDVAI